MRIRIRTESGFTLIEMMIIVLLVGLLAGLAVPNFIKARMNAQSNACVSNLRQIEGAKQTWGVETGKTDADVPTEAELVGASLYLKEMPECPAGGNYQFNKIGDNATCSIGGAHSL